MLSKLRSTLVCTIDFLARPNKLFYLLAVICVFGAAEQQALASPDTTTTTLAITASGSSVTSVSAGTVVTLTATVSTGSTLVTRGQVNFCDAAPAHCTDIHLLATAQLTSAGNAVLKFIPGIGSHSYQAVFIGTTTNMGSSTPPSDLVVSAASTFPSTTTITSSGNPGNYTLIATVTGAANTPPAGTVSFLDTTNANYVLATGSPGPSELSFTNVSNPVLTVSPGSVAVGDFNGDGIPDLAVPEGSPLTANNVVILLGHGDGTFTTASTFPAGVAPSHIVVVDFNGDGNQDLAFSNFVSNTVDIWLGHGDGTFTFASSYPTGLAPLGVVAQDFNGDGIPDLAVVAGLADPTDTLTVLLGNGDGTFTAAPSPTLGSLPREVVSADFNGDGIPDLVVGNSGDNTVTLFLGNGDGTFTNKGTTPVGSQPYGLVAADFNDDGKVDLAVANFAGNNGSVLLGNGDGTFTTGAPLATGQSPYGLAFGDFNGDGKADLITTNFFGTTVTVMLGNGDGTFTNLPTLTTINNPIYLATGDFNGDGLTDFAMTTGENNTVPIYLAGATAATATVTGISPVGTGIHYVDASYAGDTAYSSSVSDTIPLTAEPVATTLTLTNPSTSSLGQQVTLTATLTPDLAQNHNATGTVIFTSNGITLGTGSIANGVASLNITTLLTGIDTLSATYSGDTNFAPSSTTNSITVGGTNNTLLATAILTANPTSSTFGNPVTLTATVSATNPPGPSTPTGTVTFSYTDATTPGSTALGTVTLTSGVAVLVTTVLPVGNDNINCTYSGSSIYSPATCISQPLTGTPPTNTLTSSANPAPALTPITFTAQFSEGASNGTIVFAVDGQNITTTPNAAGISTYTISTLTPGSYLVTATWFASNSALAAQASLTQIVTAPAPIPDFSLTGSSITFPADHSATGDLQLASLGGFTGNVAITCNPPFPPNYTCSLQDSTISLTSGLSTVFTYTLHSSYTASAAHSRPFDRSTRIVLASLFPLTLLSLSGFARRRRTPLRTLLTLTLLAILASATAACGPDQFIPITTGTYPITFTATGTNQDSTTPITHTLTINAIITP